MTPPEHTHSSCCHNIPTVRTWILQFDVLTSSWKKKITGKHTSKIFCVAMQCFQIKWMHIHTYISRVVINAFEYSSFFYWLEQSHSHQLHGLWLLCEDKASWASNAPFVVWFEKTKCAVCQPFDYFSNHLLGKASRIIPLKQISDITPSLIINYSLIPRPYSHAHERVWFHKSKSLGPLQNLKASNQITKQHLLE